MSSCTPWGYCEHFDTKIVQIGSELSVSIAGHTHRQTVRQFINRLDDPLQLRLHMCNPFLFTEWKLHLLFLRCLSVHQNRLTKIG